MTKFRPVYANARVALDNITYIDSITSISDPRMILVLLGNEAVWVDAARLAEYLFWDWRK